MVNKERFKLKICDICKEGFYPTSGRQCVCLGDECLKIFSDLVDKEFSLEEIAKKLFLNYAMTSRYLEKLGLQAKRKYNKSGENKPKEKPKIREQECQDCKIDNQIEMPQKCFEKVVIRMEKTCRNIPNPRIRGVGKRPDYSYVKDLQGT